MLLSSWPRHTGRAGQAVVPGTVALRLPRRRALAIPGVWCKAEQGQWPIVPPKATMGPDATSLPGGTRHHAPHPFLFLILFPSARCRAS
jgi:hypothetical protein